MPPMPGAVGAVLVKVMAWAVRFGVVIVSISEIGVALAYEVEAVKLAVTVQLPAEVKLTSTGADADGSEQFAELAVGDTA